ncbi:MAG: sugar phosphate isomerase/epimerase [Desulfobacteraceae bacterium]|nr:sugar phosphate isomerase/epimerase [Desulfobacteraceae bacterium]
MFPKLAMCNFIPDNAELLRFAREHGFSGIDWTITLDCLPDSVLEEARLQSMISGFQDLEIRYHCAFRDTDLGDEDDSKAAMAMENFRKASRVIAGLGGRHMTVHLGLGRKSPAGLSWNRTLRKLASLVDYAGELGICLCLENLASGWSSRPELFEKLIRKTGASVTLDIGHARVSPSVQSQIYELVDFVSPHSERVRNAHIYHEEIADQHVAPRAVDDVRRRLDLLGTIGCDWWVLELRREAPLLQTLEVVRQYLDETPQGPLLAVGNAAAKQRDAL